MKTWEASLHEVRVRRYRDGDAPAVRALHDPTPPAGSPPTSTPQPWNPDLDDIPRHFAAFWVAEIDEEVVGMAGLVPIDDDVPTSVIAGFVTRQDGIRLTRMRVAPEWQRHGIGSRLVETILAWAREWGSIHVVLETTTEQVAAIALYRRHGFGEVAHTTLGRWELVWMHCLVRSGNTEGDEESQNGYAAYGSSMERDRSWPTRDHRS